MRIFWLFRSNLTELESYHSIDELKPFLKFCHDFYLLMSIWFLKNGYFDKVIIWRLTNHVHNDIIFDVDGKKFIQRWVTSFDKCTELKPPTMSLFRGGFKEYDDVTKVKPDRFGLKLYLGAGQRIFPKWGGKYDVILLEDERDFEDGIKCLPFFKTASPTIFFPMSTENIFDICWPCNFTQIRYKGQEFFIEKISNSNFLKSLKIIHCGNKSDIGKQLCQKYRVNNIVFSNWKQREDLNILLNNSKFGLNLSNRLDGCPRVSTEIIMSGAPLFIREQTRLLNYYKRKGVIVLQDNNIENQIKDGLDNYEKYRSEILEAVKNDLSFERICQLNIDLWNRI